MFFWMCDFLKWDEEKTNLDVCFSGMKPKYVFLIVSVFLFLLFWIELIFCHYNTDGFSFLITKGYFELLMDF